MRGGVGAARRIVGEGPLNKAMMIARLLLLVVLLVTACVSAEISSVAQITRLLDHVERLASYWGRKDVQELQLVDGIFGVRTGQAACTKVAETNALPEALRRKARGLASKLSKIAGTSASFAKSSDRAYYEQFRPMIEHSTKLPFHTRALPSKMLAGRKHGAQEGRSLEQMDEDKSDDCFSKLMGTPGLKGPHTAAHRCEVTAGCFKMMTVPHTEKYLLTHQVLWFEMAAQFGCGQELQKVYSHHGHEGLVSAVVAAKCGAIYREMHTEPVQSDIFLEQLYTCGAFGYSQFFHESWLNTVMRAQDPKSGCYKSAGHSVAESSRQLLDRRDAATSDGCSLHKSSVATCLFAVYLRHFASLAAGRTPYHHGRHFLETMDTVMRRPGLGTPHAPAPDFNTDNGAVGLDSADPQSAE